MNALKTSLLAATAASSLLLGLSGLAGAQPPARGGTDAIAGPPPEPVAGLYCADASNGQVWVANGTQVTGVYCTPNTPPVHEVAAFPSSMPDDPDQGSQ